MSFKTVSITLPEKMIQEIDEMLLDNNFASRSDLFRHLVRMWQLQPEQKTTKSVSHEAQDNRFDEVDLEYGIPSEVIKELEEKAKLIS